MSSLESLLGRGPIGDDDLWHHHIGRFSPFSLFSFSFLFPSPWGLSPGSEVFPAEFGALPAGFEALPTGSEALSSDSEAHPAGSETLPAGSKAYPA